MIKNFLIGVLALGFVTMAVSFVYSDDTPVVPAELRFRLRNVQWDSAKIQNINLQLVQQYQNNLNQITKDATEAQQIVDEIYKETKTDKSIYDFNSDTMAFTKKPQEKK